MLLVIDNYDSFTYNLVQYFGELGQETIVIRNDKISAEDIFRDYYKNDSAERVTHICISPGPCDPDRAGNSISIIEEFADKIPILGVCLGHQCIAQVFGSKVVRAKSLMHGKTSLINHDGLGIFKNIPNPFTATRYHSLIVEKSSLSDNLRITATTDEGEIMGLQHKTLQCYGVQFHPESFLTTNGKTLLQNFLNL